MQTIAQTRNIFETIPMPAPPKPTPKPTQSASIYVRTARSQTFNWCGARNPKNGGIVTPATQITPPASYTPTPEARQFKTKEEMDALCYTLKKDASLVSLAHFEWDVQTHVASTPDVFLLTGNGRFYLIVQPGGRVTGHHLNLAHKFGAEQAYLSEEQILEYLDDLSSVNDKTVRVYEMLGEDHEAPKELRSFILEAAAHKS